MTSFIVAQEPVDRRGVLLLSEKPQHAFHVLNAPQLPYMIKRDAVFVKDISLHAAAAQYLKNDPLGVLMYNRTIGLQVVYGAGIYRRIRAFRQVCHPNAFITFGDEQRLNVVSLRPIAKGEEITICTAQYEDGDCAARHDSTSQCDCDDCQQYRREGENKEPSANYSFQRPQMELDPSSNSDVIFHLYMQRLIDLCPEQNCEEEIYKLTRMAMKCEKWAEFCAKESNGPFLVYLGLVATRSALMQSPSDDWFIHQWSNVLSRAQHARGIHGQRFGVLTVTLVEKFFGLSKGVTNGKVRDFLMTFKHLIEDGLTLMGTRENTLVMLEFTLHLLNMQKLWGLLVTLFSDKK